MVECHTAISQKLNPTSFVIHYICSLFFKGVLTLNKLTPFLIPINFKDYNSNFCIMNKAILIILDGWGIGNKGKGDVVFNADTPNMDKLSAEFPTSQLLTSGTNVGLCS